jgi:hypothetical protein
MEFRIYGIEDVIETFDDIAAIDDDLKDLRRDFAMGVHGNIVQATPVAKKHGGFLRTANQVMQVGEDVIFRNFADYASFVDLGTGRRGAASFTSYIPEDEYGIAFATYWAGMEGQAFMRRPIAEGLTELEREIDARIDRID